MIFCTAQTYETVLSDVTWAALLIAHLSYWLPPAGSPVHGCSPAAGGTPRAELFPPLGLLWVQWKSYISTNVACGKQNRKAHMKNCPSLVLVLSSTYTVACLPLYSLGWQGVSYTNCQRVCGMCCSGVPIVCSSLLYAATVSWLPAAALLLAGEYVCSSSHALVGLTA